MTYRHHKEANAIVHATPENLFAYLDDQARLGAHMEKPSAMMMGGQMKYQFDSANGQAVGSVIKMSGSFLGIELSVEEVITECDSPRRKIWETRGHPQLLIIRAYRMGFETISVDQSSRLRIFIEYDYPRDIRGCILGELFGSAYARWCVKRMAEDAARHFK